MPVFRIHLECFVRQSAVVEVEAENVEEALAIAHEGDLEKVEMEPQWGHTSTTRIHAVSQRGKKKDLKTLDEELAPHEEAHRKWLDASL